MDGDSLQRNCQYSGLESVASVINKIFLVHRCHTRICTCHLWCTVFFTRVLCCLISKDLILRKNCVGTKTVTRSNQKHTKMFFKCCGRVIVENLWIYCQSDYGREDQAHRRDWWMCVLNILDLFFAWISCTAVHRENGRVKLFLSHVSFFDLF